MAADRPQEVRAAKELRVFLTRQEPGIDERLVGVDAVKVLAIQKSVCRSRCPPLPSLTFGSTR